MKIEAVVFDMDGLMFDTETLIAGYIEKTLIEFGYNIHNFLDWGYRYVIGNRPDKKEQNMRELLKIDLDWGAFWKRMLFFYEQHIKIQGIKKKKGLDNLLNFLKENNIKTAIASSSPKKFIELVCNSAGISLNSFDCVVAGEDVTQSKPHPEIYQVACKKLKVAPEKAIALEDGDYGIMSASSAGMLPVLIPDIKINDESTDKLIFKTIKSLDEVIDIIKDLINGR